MQETEFEAELGTQGTAGLGWQKRAPCSKGKAGNLQYMCPEETHRLGFGGLLAGMFTAPFSENRRTLRVPLPGHEN